MFINDYLRPSASALGNAYVRSASSANGHRLHGGTRGDRPELHFGLGKWQEGNLHSQSGTARHRIWDERKQHCPTLTADEITHIVANAKGRYRVAAALLAGSNMRISELLALRIEKHVSDDRSTLFIRQQRRKRGGGVTDTLKTPAADRDIDLHSALAKMVDEYIGDRNEGFLFETENGKMLSPVHVTVFYGRPRQNDSPRSARPLQ
jgi:integrase